MFVLNESVHSKKRLRDPLESVHDPSRDDTERPAKRKRSTQSDVYTGHRPPEFWDVLSKISLTREALKELDRRKPPSGQQHSIVSADRGSLTELTLRQLQRPSYQLRRFSRHGGPDLTQVRGFALFNNQDGAMSQSSSKRKRSSASGRSDSTQKSRWSHDPNLRQNMIDGGLYPHDRESKPRNIHEVRSHMSEYRASLSPSQFDDAQFEEFADLNDRLASETRSIADVFTIIEGKGRHNYHSGGPDHPFNHLTPLSDFLPIPKPDTYDGALPAQIDPLLLYVVFLWQWKV